MHMRPMDGLVVCVGAAEVQMSGVKHVMFIDDNFVGNPKWTRSLMARLKDMGVKWNVAVSINVVNIPGMLDDMKACGCQGLFIGFESINPASVSGVHKSTPVLFSDWLCRKVTYERVGRW